MPLDLSSLDPEGARIRRQNHERAEAERAAFAERAAARAARPVTSDSLAAAIEGRWKGMSDRHAAPRVLSPETAAAQQQMRERMGPRPSLAAALEARLQAERDRRTARQNTAQNPEDAA